MGRVVSFELNSQDPERANSFYSSVFGWTIHQPNWDYWPVTAKQEGEAGIDGGIALGPPDYPHGVRMIVQVESVDDALKKAAEQGARTIREKMEFDEFYLAYMVDPVGLCFGLIQYKS
ncbi:VOC family protein [Paenibacillus sp. 481]|uniref:VOC family protein n=1 Tax=Paenibacillus sp. 481 TaxID=2835869 RepID=UPI001E398293|nr:VOC family protein [Paenibacillus sp. 481]UHA73783.1 hypothetical protein KIK04_01010 [Paenibacillus sp. 481]